MNDRTKRQLRQDLRAGFRDCEPGESHLGVDELVAYGIPRRFAQRISLASRQMTSADRPDEVADEWADTVIGELEADDDRPVADIIKSIPPVA